MKREADMARRGSLAFTLVETLVVVSIVGLLTALLFPSLSRALEAGRTAKCLSNIRQLSEACLAYSGDNDNVLIPIASGSNAASARTWRFLVTPYLGQITNNSVFVCPSDRIERGRQVAASEAVSGVRPTSYGLNLDTATFPLPPVPLASDHRINEYMGTPSGIRQTAVVKPAETILLADLGFPASPSLPVAQWKETTHAANFGYVRFPADAGFSGGGDQWDIYPRHGGARANVAFYDGHAATIDIVRDLVPYVPGDPQCIYDNH